MHPTGLSSYFLLHAITTLCTSRTWANAPASIRATRSNLFVVTAFMRSYGGKT